MIQKEWVKQIERYSFIDKVEIKGASFIIHYTKDEKKRFKKFPLRVSGDQIQKAITKIKKDLGVKHVERKKGNYYII